MFSLRRLFVLSALGMFFCSLPCLPQSSVSQKSASKPDAASPASPSAQSNRYQNEPGVIEALDTEYRYAVDGTGSKQVTLTALLQTEAEVKQLSVLTVPFAGNTQHVVFDYVRVRRPDGSIVETPPADAQEMPEQVTLQAPFYSDLKEMQIPVRSLAVGDTLEYRAHIVQTKAEAPGEFWGEHRLLEGMGGLNETVELRVPKSKYVQVWSPTLKPAVTEEGKKLLFGQTAAKIARA